MLILILSKPALSLGTPDALQCSCDGVNPKQATGFRGISLGSVSPQGPSLARKMISLFEETTSKKDLVTRINFLGDPVSF